MPEQLRFRYYFSSSATFVFMWEKVVEKVDSPRPRGFLKVILPMNQPDNKDTFAHKGPMRNPRGLSPTNG